MTTDIHPAPEVRRAQVLSLAMDYATSNSIEAVEPEARRIGVNLCDPLSMAALSVLADCLRFGVEPSPRALLHLGVSDAA